jgi:hypothetical protein
MGFLVVFSALGFGRAPLDLKSVVRSRYAWHLGFVYMMFGFAYMVYFTFFQKRLTADLGFSSSAAGVFFLGGVFSVFLRETGWRTAIGARQVEAARPKQIGPVSAGIQLQLPDSGQAEPRVERA